MPPPGIAGASLFSSSALTETAHDKRTHLGDAIEVGVDVHHAQAVMKRCCRDQQVGDGRAMPHAMVMCEIALQAEPEIEHVGGRVHDPKACAELGVELVVMARGSRRIELLELCDGAEVKQARKLLELRRDRFIGGARCGALVEDPTRYRHMSPDASTRMSTLARSFWRYCRCRWARPACSASALSVTRRSASSIVARIVG
jgi:hypothetical protein